MFATNQSPRPRLWASPCHSCAANLRKNDINQATQGLYREKSIITIRSDIYKLYLQP